MLTDVKADVWERISIEKVIAVIVVEESWKAVETAKALKDGGVNVIELTLRNQDALNALEAIRMAVPDSILGAGTVLTTNQLMTVSEMGVDFTVAPGLNPRVVNIAQEIGLPFAPGVMSPSEIEVAAELGCRYLKLFPAEQSGGLPYIKSVIAPYAHLGLKFMPLGGLNEKIFMDYLDVPQIAAVGGSWITQAHLIKQENWAQIRMNAIDTRYILDKGNES
ncbi:bifunctional 4-hydroxy-2-oxoglutarate aldolase/2-dehydro-3-deoxy-phosphogluconate aldolase [Poriferisphaera sp. WC338]|uniref:bifunctional 4-hydroxy-2-oxoglutarate aldolase/2-dehydro-3-deoxy-phosphogluconate aldolase n=1 Tax=Poriferisphaera sp. WC338 TaxID=3425129 RepID=UPI003D817A20